MKREFALILSTAVMSAALMLPGSAYGESDPTGAGQAEAQQMVSARVALKEDINAIKAKQGDEIRTTLAHKVALKDGTELPAGTVILGVIAEDDMQQSGTSKLALNFDKAELKDGKVIPIKATILGIYPPESEDMEGRPVEPGDQETGNWAGHPLAVDQVGALQGFDMHSQIASDNSGVLVSAKKHDVKLRWGSEIALAIAAQPSSAAGE
jgi:hypothetical protein